MNVLILDELDVLVDAADVMVLVDAADVIVVLEADVAHEAREMSAAITIQKKPALNSMTAILIQRDGEYCNTDGAAVGAH